MNETELKEYIRREILRAVHIPVGAIFAYPSERIPDGFLPCEGQELSCTQYPELFKLIGQTFGGQGNTFYLPDLQGQFIRGLDRTGNDDLSENGSLREIGSSQIDALQGHCHSIDISSLDVSVAGGHDHDLYWAEFKVRDYSINDINNHTQNFAMPYSDRDNKSMFGRTDMKSMQKDGTNVEGAHIHSLTIKDGHRFLGDPVSSTFGKVEHRIASETRPKNIALIFCIKVK